MLNKLSRATSKRQTTSVCKFGMGPISLIIKKNNILNNITEGFRHGTTSAMWKGTF
jgi:hypothetical protein